VTTLPCTLAFPCALANGLSFDSSILVKTFEESDPEFKSDKSGKRILASPADKLDLPFFVFIEKKRNLIFYDQNKFAYHQGLFS
jgi:hypothetical protein